MLTLRAARLKHEWFYLGLNQEPLNKKQLSELDRSERAPEQLQAARVEAGHKQNRSFPHSDSSPSAPKLKKKKSD